MPNQPDLTPDARWKQRYRATDMAIVHRATQNHRRGVVCSNRNGTYQMFAWDIEAGTLEQRSTHPSGTTRGYISADGAYIYYMQSEQGHNIGHFFRVPFEGGQPEDLTPQMPAYSSFYITEAHSGAAMGFLALNQQGFQIFVRDRATGEQLFSYQDQVMCVGPLLSHDGDVVAIATTERSQTTDFMLEAYDIGSGRRLGELFDGATVNIHPVGFVPRADDPRLLAMTYRSGLARPVIWNPRTGERHDFDLPELEGDVLTWDWSEDGRYLLLCHEYRATHHLYRYDLEQNTLQRLDKQPSGTYESGAFTSSGTLLVNMQDAVQPSRLLELDAATGDILKTLLPPADVPDGHAWQSVTFSADDDTLVQAWLTTPDTSDAPYPLVVYVHGGPADVLTEMFHPGIQTWVEHGFAVLGVNYRGSTTFGLEFIEAIQGQPGTQEVRDIVAGVRWLLNENIADPENVFITGSSYGGFLALLALSTEPDLWAGGMATAAIADWSRMYEEVPETLQRYQQQLFGGTPDEKPQQYADASPITRADAIQADVLLIQERGDARSPAGQIEAYIEKLRALDKSVQVHWFETRQRGGQRQIDTQTLMLKFAFEVLS